MITTRRYTTLDAMRGLAAAAVVCLHFGYQTGAPHPELGYLAVDAFFVLSGFVLALRYDGDFAKGRLNFASFMVMRIKRLGPIYAVGLLLGLLVQFTVKPLPINTASALIADLMNAFAIPGFSVLSPKELMFPINAPFWSLFLELWIANTIYALFWRRIRGVALLGLMALGAVGLTVCALSGEDMSCGFTEATIFLGFARVVYSFFAGVFIARLYALKKLPLSVPAPLLLLALAAVLAAPVHGRAAIAVDVGAMIFGFPLLTYLGAQASYMPTKIGTLLVD